MFSLDPCTGWAENFLKQNGPGLKFGGPDQAINFRPAQVRFIEMSRTHSALVHSFLCILHKYEFAPKTN